MKIIGYADRFSAFPGDDVDILVSCETPNYHADLVQLIHGDTNPDGPGFKVQKIENTIDDDHGGRVQHIHTGSWAEVSDTEQLRFRDAFSFVTMVNPTRLAAGEQAIITKWDASREAGVGLYVNDSGCLEFRVGDGNGGADRVSSGKALIEGIWYLAIGTYEGGKLTVRQQPYVTRTNGRFAIASSLDSTTSLETSTTAIRPELDNGVPLRFAAHVEKTTDDLIRWVPGALFNGKIDSPRVYATALSPDAALSTIENPASVDGLVAAWDFENEIGSDGIAEPRSISDSSGDGMHGTTVNMPTRAVTGYN
ncbi:LamG domain-containing protein [Rhodococcus qingshengii]|uniref:LamG domain-containing protein n=1 Tax=Rhodococcus qingshengii TaxID=334542 RepID=UPI001C5E0CAB|nr:LamG domain-containing protein [Rhodococcus qingshengii]MBW4818696.1 LamG domain-containing protein [Rhodococcus qingshengii]